MNGRPCPREAPLTGPGDNREVAERSLPRGSELGKCVRGIPQQTPSRTGHPKVDHLPYSPELFTRQTAAVQAVGVVATSTEANS